MPGHPHTQSPFIRVISLPQRDNPPARQAALYRIAVNSRGTLALEENRTLCVNGGPQECTQIDREDISEPVWGICVHYCGARVVGSLGPQ